jgi:prolyl oligopeptidase
MFPVIRKYSPLHNIKKGVAYPPTLILTSDHDDRVVPAHSYKFAATMQADQAGSNPILIHITTSAGHGAGMPVDKQIDEASDWLSFLMAYLK